MSEDFSDDFIVEEEEQGANRTFLIIAGALVGVFILIILCVGLFAVLNRTDNSAQIAAIETENAETAQQNARVTETIVAMELTAQAPTATFTPSPSPEPTDTLVPTAAPTDTPVVQTPEGGEEGTGISLDGGTTTVTPNPDGSGVSLDGGTTTVTPNADGTSIFGGSGGTFVTGTPIAGTGAGGSGGTGSGSGSGSGSESLPQTGISTVGLVAIGLLLVVGLVVARRLRTG